MKINEITPSSITLKHHPSLDETTNIELDNKKDHFMGIPSGSKKHTRMKEILDWTKDSDPELYNKIINLD